jgi:hypothetical protein
VVNDNFGAHATAGSVEVYAARVSSHRGTVTSFAQDPVGTLNSANDGLQLNKYLCSSYFCDASQGPFTVLLPAASGGYGPPQGSRLRFIKTDASEHQVTIAVPGGVSTIEGARSARLSAPYQKLQLIYGASGDETWYKL